MVLLFSFGMCLFSGCGTEKEGKRGKDLDYTVVPTEECPADFLSEINKKKINPFQMTYEDGEYCYLAVGYGEQETNGFSVRVRGLSEKGEDIYQMLQSSPANENGFINSVNGKSYQEYNKWLKGALENSLQEGVIDGCKLDVARVEKRQFPLLF